MNTSRSFPRLLAATTTFALAFLALPMGPSFSDDALEQASSDEPIAVESGDDIGADTAVLEPVEAESAVIPDESAAESDDAVTPVEADAGAADAENALGGETVEEPVIEPAGEDSAPAVRSGHAMRKASPNLSVSWDKENSPCTIGFEVTGIKPIDSVETYGAALYDKHEGTGILVYLKDFTLKAQETGFSGELPVHKVDGELLDEIYVHVVGPSDYDPDDPVLEERYFYIKKKFDPAVYGMTLNEFYSVLGQKGCEGFQTENPNLSFTHDVSTCTVSLKISNLNAPGEGKEQKYRVSWRNGKAASGFMLKGADTEATVNYGIISTIPSGGLPYRLIRTDNGGQTFLETGTYKPDDTFVDEFNKNCAGTVKAESLSSCQMKITISGIKIPGDYALRVDHADGKVKQYTLTLPDDNEFVIPLQPTMVDLGSGQYGHEIYLKKIMPEDSFVEALSTTYVSEHDNEWIENNCRTFDAEYSQCHVTATVFDAASGKYRIQVLNESSDGKLRVLDTSEDFDWVVGGEAKTMSFRLRENLESDKLVVRLVDAVTKWRTYESVIEQEGLQNSVKQCLLDAENPVPGGSDGSQPGGGSSGGSTQSGTSSGHGLARTGVDGSQLGLLVSVAAGLLLAGAGSIAVSRKKN